MQIIGVWYGRPKEMVLDLLRPTVGMFHGNLRFTDKDLTTIVGRTEDHLGEASIVGVFEKSSTGRAELMFTKRYDPESHGAPNPITFKFFSQGWGFSGTYEFLGRDSRTRYRGNAVCVLI